MKTAIRQLMEWMEKTEFMVNTAFIDKVNECLELEKEQIIVAHNFGYLVGEDNISIKDANKASERYYALTYNQLPSESKTLLEILDLENEKNIINDIIDKSDKHE
jgi:hypothetical protein